jgi:hypothetical protein
MKTTINLNQFRDAFYRMGRKTNFSYEGLEILFEYLEELEEGTDQEIELDVIALCCDFSEDTPENIGEAYGIPMMNVDFDNPADVLDCVVDFLRVQGVLVGITKDGKIVFQNY